MDKALKILWMVFISNNEATEVLQPGEQSPHFEATTISPQRTPILSGFLR